MIQDVENNVYIMTANIFNIFLIMYALFAAVTNLYKFLHKNVLVFVLIVLFLILHYFNSSFENKH